MIELLKEKILPFKTDSEKYNFLREYFQLLILKIMDEQGYFRQLAFMGGTALRILYDLERFSEDLDFNLILEKSIDFNSMMFGLKRELQLTGLEVDIHSKNRKTVAIAQFKFASILHALGLSSLKDQKIMIKFEVDKKPAKGFDTVSTLINKEFLISIHHLDKPSLFSSKLQAVFCRKYTKGRDYYDLMWYLTKKIHPNFKYLNAGFVQQGYHKQCHDLNDLKALLQEKINKADFKKILEDLRSFLIDAKQARFFDKEVFLSLVDQL